MENALRFDSLLVDLDGFSKAVNERTRLLSVETIGKSRTLVVGECGECGEYKECGLHHR